MLAARPSQVPEQGRAEGRGRREEGRVQGVVSSHNREEQAKGEEANAWCCQQSRSGESGHIRCVVEPNADACMSLT